MSTAKTDTNTETPAAGAASAATWRAAGKRSLQEFKNDILQDRAAALTY
jgi:hypothetical protein